MAKSYYHDGTDWQALIRGEPGGPGPKGNPGASTVEAIAAADRAEAARDDAAAYAAGMNVQVGGRNYLRTDPFWKPYNSTTLETFEVNDGVLHVAEGGTRYVGQDIPAYPLNVEGVTSFWAKASASQSLRVRFYGSTTNVSATQYIYLSDEWEHYSLPGAVRDSDLHSGFMLELTSGGEAWFKEVKFEKGNKATDWTPAPEDIGVNPDTAQWAAPHSLALELADAAARTIVGVGRPDIPATLTTPGTAALVAAATSGTVFRSTDGPQGAWEWRKKGAAWAIIDADTGWRDISDLLINGWTTPTALHIRRINERVYVFGRVNGTAATANTVLELPAGFASYRPGHATVRPDDFIISTANVSTAGRLPHTHVDIAFTAAYLSWPTVLPGTPA